MNKIYAPLRKEAIINLKIGQKVLLTGTIYTARDQAHKRMLSAIRNRNSAFSRLQPTQRQKY